MFQYLRAINVFITLLLGLSFNNAQSQTGITNQLKDSVKKFIPQERKGQPSWFYEKKIEMEKKMGLKSIENGYDSLEIRFWYGVAFRDTLQLLILRDSESAWSARLCFLGLIYDSSGRSLVSVTQDGKAIKPRSGWPHLCNRLFGLHILNLPDSRSIPEYRSANDGYGVTIEIATRSIYRIYNYSNFNGQPGIKEAKKIEQIMELLENEFGFRWLSLE